MTHQSVCVPQEPPPEASHHLEAAHERTPTQTLAQYAATGCLNATFCASAKTQLNTVSKLVPQVEPEMIAKCAVYAKARGHLQDMPVFLLASLADRDPAWMARAFDRVVDNGKTLRRFVQVMRSGVTGRRSLGTASKRHVQQWLEAHSDEGLFKASFGHRPSLADVIKMVHPKPSTPSRSALYGYLIGKPVDQSHLPPMVQAYEAYRAGHRRTLPKVPFQMLTRLNLGRAEWTEIARHAPWHMTRVNLNTFQRHGVFEDPKIVARVARRLRNPEAIREAKIFPYQMLTAYHSAKDRMPPPMVNALHDMMEAALHNIPRFISQTHVLVNASRDMHAPITGRHHRGRPLRSLDIAALIAVGILRKNRRAEAIAFDHRAGPHRLDPHDSVLANAERLASLGGENIDSAALLQRLNHRQAKGNLVIFISNQRSEVIHEWAEYKRRNPNAKLVCIDLAAKQTGSPPARADILHVGGFSDAVFDVMAGFNRQQHDDHWVQVIRDVHL